ncbi:hypothetical protein SIAM614_00979 [Stappia aggregata IAM 12614]|uniref:Uncharacterized protein n=1 Tax=Roseibium aggregatum (strain ATCC 25650 / DSM 13394 / JCM 20685 / NBRC 16684 / NCIMB 2208 / IAM 12614 / B1) TaxID=384765 RepID=A0P0K6_ROSAI|nr:type III secretion system inner rod subunit SctI [Roseibium aggregatum]EAV41320.1 hypothetical protein SIAM614_00979 [Stappia aggregata IAM 12614] [Roseibium aggregatum IAM 12614]
MISNGDVASFSMQMPLPREEVAADAGGAAASSVDRFVGAMKVAQAHSAPEVEADLVVRPASVAETAEGGTGPRRQGGVPGEPIRPDEAAGAGNTYAEISAAADAAKAAARASASEVGFVPRADGVEDNKGDIILDGLSWLRGAFDAQADKVAETSTASVSGTERLLETQMEIVKYSLLMDVTSKLVGKSTQTFDTLMKGQ